MHYLLKQSRSSTSTFMWYFSPLSPQACQGLAPGRRQNDCLPSPPAVHYQETCLSTDQCQHCKGHFDLRRDGLKVAEEVGTEFYFQTTDISLELRADLKSSQREPSHALTFT